MHEGGGIHSAGRCVAVGGGRQGRDIRGGRERQPSHSWLAFSTPSPLCLSTPCLLCVPFDTDTALGMLKRQASVSDDLYCCPEACTAVPRLICSARPTPSATCPSMHDPPPCLCLCLCHLPLNA